MNQNAVVILCVLLSLPSFGVIPKLCLPGESRETDLFHNIGFSPAGEAIAEVPKMLNIMSSVVKLNKDFGGAGCSGFFISDKGHFATSAHCLRDCVYDADGVAIPKKIIAACPMLINGKEAEFEVVSVPKCDNSFWSALEQKKAEFSDRTKKECADSPPGDLAILRLKTPKDFKFNCLEIEAKAAGVDTAVYALGFPKASQRPPERDGQSRNSDGQQMQFSHGSLVDQSHCDWRGRNWLGQVRESRQEIPTEFTSRENFYQATVDILPGSSGGPLIDRKTNKVIGITSHTINLPGFFGRSAANNETEECKGATFFQRVDALDQRMKAYKAEHAPPAMRCSSKRAVAAATK